MSRFRMSVACRCLMPFHEAKPIQDFPDPVVPYRLETPERLQTVYAMLDEQEMVGKLQLNPPKTNTGLL